MRSLARRSDKDELVRRLRLLRPDSARRWGRMSVHQMVCHVGDCFDMALGHKPVTPATGLVPAVIVKWVALYVPVRWPSGIETSPEVDPERDGTRPAEFAADLARSLELIDRVCGEGTNFGGRRHPVFGRMSDAEWRRWGYLHTDHHLRQFGV
jgi:hypothetical protein